MQVQTNAGDMGDSLLRSSPAWLKSLRNSMPPCSSPIIGFLCEWVRRASTQLEKWNCLRALCNFSCIICGTSSVYFPSESLKLPPLNKHFLCSGAANTFGVHGLPCCECCLQKWLIKLVVHSCISHTASPSLCKPWPLHKFYSKPGLTKITLTDSTSWNFFSWLQPWENPKWPIYQ